MRTNMTVTLTLCCLFLATALSAREFTPIEEKMNPQQLEQSGLDKLSATELEYLNRWLDGQIDDTVEQAIEKQEHNTIGLRGGISGQRNAVEAQIDGKFTGWTGDTVFTLTNGQIWRQIGGGRYRSNADSPQITLEPKSLGSWKMYVEGISRGIKVKRIK